MDPLRENNIPALVKALSERMDRFANQKLAKFDITFSQLRVLITLNFAEDEGYALKSLEKKFQVSQQTMAGIIIRLEKKGLVSGDFDRQDRRVKKVRITEAGRCLVNDVWAEKAAVEQELLASLTEKEQVTLRFLLQKLCDN